MSPLPLLLMTALFIPFSLHAQVYKCKSPDNHVIYSDRPCGGPSVQIITDIMIHESDLNVMDDKPEVMRQLDSAVMAAIANNDLTRAKALATTHEHREWVAAAIKENAQKPGKTEAELQSERANSSECIRAKRNLEAEANNGYSNPDVLSARKSLMYTACGQIEPVILQQQQAPNTILYGFPYGNRFNQFPYQDQWRFQHHQQGRPGGAGRPGRPPRHQPPTQQPPSDERGGGKFYPPSRR
jgi:hypothetical protein